MPLFDWEKVSRDDPYYKACLAGSTLFGTATGTTMGSLTLPVVGTVAGWASGGAIGFAAGYLACPYMAPGMRRKLEAGTDFSVSEAREAAEVMGRYAGVQKASDAVKLLAIVRATPKSVGQTCSNPSVVARTLLSA